MRFGIPLIVILCTLAPSAFAERPVDKRAHPYYDCMLKQSSNYGKKTKLAAEAIEAAGSACSEERQHFAAEITADLIEHGQSVKNAEEITKRALARLDHRWHKDFVKNVLDAK